jgi:hypothetical protein
LSPHIDVARSLEFPSFLSRCHHHFDTISHDHFDIILLAVSATTHHFCSRMPTTRPTKGSEKLLVIYRDQTPCEIETVTRWKPHTLLEHFQEAMVFVRNKNLHRFERGLKGAIMWVPHLKKIVVVVRACGAKGIVQQIYPSEEGDKEPLRFEMSMLLDGFFLQQIHGTALVTKYYSDKALEPNLPNLASTVIPLTDNNGFVKMNVEGPDIAWVGSNVGIHCNLSTDMKE